MEKVAHLIIKRNSDGSLRHYWEPSPTLRAAGWRTRPLSDDPATATAEAGAINSDVKAWRLAGEKPLATAAADPQKIVRGTVRDLIHLYKNPPGHAVIDPEADLEGRLRGLGLFRHDYPSLQQKTRDSYDSCLKYIDLWMGTVPVRKVTQAIVQQGLRSLAEDRHESGPFEGKFKHAHAHAVQRVGRLLFHASRSLVAPEHPCYVAKHLNPWASIGIRSPQRIKPVLWSREARDLIVAAAVKMESMSIAVAVILNWWIGQRLTDVLALGHNFNPGDILEIVQSKTAGEVFLDMGAIREIADAIDALREDQRRRRLVGIKLLVDERNGLTWTANRFAKEFAQVRAAAVGEALHAGRDRAWVEKHLASLTYMRLRHTAVTLLYEAGATLQEVASITGHTLQSVTQIVERYGQRTAKTARNAFAKRLAQEGGSDARQQSILSPTGSGPNG
jgi:integrase